VREADTHTRPSARMVADRNCVRERRLPIGSVHSDAESVGSDTGPHQRVPALARSRVGGQLVFERLRALGIAIGR
jgi:hypothetical protein